MKLKKIRSGGQTGVDLQALVEARRRGITTGGWAPKGWHTEDGPNPDLAGFGMMECGDSGYGTRTKLNVLDSDVTVWVGTENTPGFFATEKATRIHKKSFFINPSPETFRTLCEMVEEINIAGNRLSKNPDGPDAVQALFRGLDGPRPEPVAAARAEVA